MQSGIVFDRRRITFPRETFVALPKKEAVLGSLATGTSAGSNTREDGRLPEDIRPIYMSCGLLSQANGSAYMEIGKTKVICGIYGPRQVQRTIAFSEEGNLRCFFHFAPFSCQKYRMPGRDSEEQEFSTILYQALVQSIKLDSFPKAIVDVFVTVLENDGSALSTAITCASLALADAGIEMFDCVAACSAGIFGNKVHLDINQKETNSAPGQLIVSHMPSINETTHIIFWGEVGPQRIAEAMDICIDGCAKIQTLMQQCLVNRIEKMEEKSDPMKQ